MNWGNKIAIVLGLFIAGMSYMVYICMKQTDIQLVATDYYEQEVNYQEVIDKKNNYNLLEIKPRLIYDSHSSHCLLDFSEVENFADVKGNVVFFRPSQSKSDKRLEISLDKDGKQSFDHNELTPGKWIVKLDWASTGKEYYNEHTLWIP